MALVPPAGFAAALAAYQAAIVPIAPGWRWTRPEDTHLTLAFLGDAGTALVDAAAAVLSQAAQTALPRLQPAVIGFRAARPFPMASRPRTLVLEPATGGPAATAIWDGYNRLLADRAARHGLSRPNPDWPARRPFRPHLTIARPLVTRPGFPGNSAALPDFPSGQFVFADLVLYSSELRPSGPLYRPLCRATLAIGA